MVFRRRYVQRARPYVGRSLTRKVRGHGGYLDFGGKYARAGGRGLMGSIGKITGIPGAEDFLGSVGEGLGNLFHKFTGVGRYRRSRVMRSRHRC